MTRAYRPLAVKAPRAEGSWAAAVAMARQSWDDLTGGPDRDTPDGLTYSTAAADAILRCALALWPHVAARLGE